jgi:serine-type D-Ala-D-Ala carboxypeptidase/endopeptidase (penicillin-binding protein 4)
VGRQDSHNDPRSDGVSEPRSDSGNGNPPAGRASVPFAPPFGTPPGNPDNSDFNVGRPAFGPATPGRGNAPGSSPPLAEVSWVDPRPAERRGTNGTDDQLMQPQVPGPPRGPADVPPPQQPAWPPPSVAGRASVPVPSALPPPAQQPPAPPVGERTGDVYQGTWGFDPALQLGAGAPANAGAGLITPAGVGRSRTKWFVGLAVLVALVLVAGVIGLTEPGPVKRWLSADPTTAAKVELPPEPRPTPVLAAAGQGGKAPSEAGVKAALDPLIGSPALGTTVHAAVLDVASSQVLYSVNADTMTTPASTTKLLTAATVLAARGPAYRLTTRAVAGGAPGEVVLVGGGDPTLSVNATGQFPGAARLDLLAQKVKRSLGGVRPTRVLVDTSLFSGPETGLGWDSNVISPEGQVARIQSLMTNAGRIKPVHNDVGGDPRYADPAIAAGKAFAKLLGAPASAVKRGRAPRAGKELGAVQSPPLVQITDWMLGQSDNTVAEAMGRQVALAAGKPATFDDATEAITDKLRGLGLPGDEADLYDASGLSRHNGISPTLLTETLSLAANGRQPALSGIFGGLPVAGWSGTLADRFVTPKTNRGGQGLVRAKTGTLSGVSTMAGELITKDGRLLVFAIMASGSADADRAKAAVDKIPARLVACGC